MMNPEDTGDPERNPVCQWTTILSVAAAVALLTFVPATAQWLKYPTSGIPRTPDGKPQLTAPAPRTADGKPDLSGLWQPNAGGYQINATADLSPSEFRPWAAGLYHAAHRRLQPRESGRAVPAAWSDPESHVGDGEDCSDTTFDRHAVRVACSGQTDLYGRPHASPGSESDVDGLFGRTLGGGHAGCRKRRLQR